MASSSRIAPQHYERVIVACAFLLLFVNVGFTSSGFSVYQAPIVALPGVGDVGGSLVVTTRTLVALICMFFTGAYYRFIRPRVGFLLATLCTGAAFMVFAFAQNLTGLCLGAVLAGVGYGLGGMVAATYLVGNWFRGKVGSVSGVVTMGSGVASIVMPILAGWIIDAFSLSAAFFVESLIALLLAALIFVFVRTSPQDVGLEAIERTASPHGPGRGHGEPPKETLSSIPLGRAPYAFMVAALVLLGGVSVAGFNYFGILLTSQGIDAGMASLLIAASGVFLTFSKFLVGIVCDRFGTFLGSLTFFILLVAGLVLCALVGTGGIPEAALAAVILGIGMPLGTTGISLWSLELSTPETMLKNIKRFQIAYAFGGFAFNMMPGILAQATGTYTTAYWVMTAMAVVCALVILAVYGRHTRLARRAYAQDHVQD